MLELRRLSVASEGRRILDGVSLDLYEGEILLVAGRSGSGKTTLLRAVAGIAEELLRLRVEGHIQVCNVKPLRPENIARYVFYVPQEPWFSISCPYPVYELLSYTSRTLEEASEALRELGVEHKLWDSSTNLSAGEAQRIALAEAMLSEKKLVLVDEVTSYLDPESRKKAINAVRKLAEQGIAVIIVDHDVAQWRGIASKVLYLENGRARLFDDPTETPIYAELEKLKRSKIELDTASGARVLEARNLWYRYPDGEDFVLKGIDLEVRQGEILWIRGASGCGKSTLLKILAGILRPSRGWVKRPKGTQLVPENPLLYISAPTPREELSDRDDLARSLGLEECLDTPILMLSSGERRRLAIASAYMREPRLLLIDEPTIGLDPWNARRVLEFLAKLARKGSGIVVASHGEELSIVATSILRVR